MKPGKKISVLGLSLLVVFSTSAYANESLPKSKVATVPAAAQATEGTATLVVTVEGIREHRGTMVIGLYNSETGRGSGKTIAGARQNVDSASIEVTFTDLAEGEYAINLFHDINADRKMDTNMFGIPTEPYAFSNNAKGNFGPAKWADAKFTVGAGVTTHVITMFK